MKIVEHSKKLARTVIDRYLAARALRNWSTVENGLLVLSYHRILPRDFHELPIVEPGMYVFDDTFDMHIQVLSQYFEFVDLEAWLQKRAAGSPLPQRAVAITFDDGWRDNFAYAFPILKQRNVPATIFVVSALAGTNHAFWPERLARHIRFALEGDSETSPWLTDLLEKARVSSRRLTPDTISSAILAAKDFTDQEVMANLADLDARTVHSDGNVRDLANWTEISDMVSSKLVRIGSHTRNHTRMHDSLSESELSAEIIGSKRDIEERIAGAATIFCFPNGDRTEAADRLVTENYIGACTTTVGWNGLHTPVHALRRVMIHQDRSYSRNAFVARISSPG